MLLILSLFGCFAALFLLLEANRFNDYLQKKIDERARAELKKEKPYEIR